MRDVGILIWVAFLIVGVAGSMVSSLRKQAQQGQRTQRPVAAEPPEWLQRVVEQMAHEQPQGPPEAAARPPAPPKPPPLPEHDARPHGVPARPQRGRHRLFAGRQAWVRAVIAAEVLGKPRGLSDEYSPR
ncbi:MAG TPA: hypothetical protein VMU38_04910 [Candidatus Binatia bacterium]|nr:hypothetical protein [Candidatus Binatia bacterium]